MKTKQIVKAILEQLELFDQELAAGCTCHPEARVIELSQVDIQRMVKVIDKATYKFGNRRWLKLNWMSDIISLVVHAEHLSGRVATVYVRYDAEDFLALEFPIYEWGQLIPRKKVPGVPLPGDSTTTDVTQQRVIYTDGTKLCPGTV